MKPRENVQFRQQDPYQLSTSGFFGGGQGELPYPGIANPYAAETSAWPTPYTPPQSPAVGGAGSALGTGVAGGAGGAGSGLNLNLGQIKGFIDRMGGIDGIVGTMTRVQKVVGSFRQMAPMLKLLMGSFGAKASSKSVGRRDLDGLSYPKNKRRRHRKGKGKGKRPIQKYRSVPGQRWTPSNKKRR